MKSVRQTIEKVYQAQRPVLADLEILLSLEDPADLHVLFHFADQIRTEYAGPGILIRGIIEFSNYCQNGCAYCGINSYNRDIRRYRLSHRQIMESVALMARAGIRTVVLQSGEDAAMSADWLTVLIEKIREKYPLAITLAVGERPLTDYRAWKKAGADRYLLKIETTDKELYQKLHPQMSFENRLICLENLRKMGYQTGTGNMVGLPGQTIKSLARDILFFKKFSFDMLGIGPFIPHRGTPLGQAAGGNKILTLKVLALTRIITRFPHLPATTALGSLKQDSRLDGLRAGANVLMPNFTPQPYKKFYDIYPGKRCQTEPTGACSFCLEGLARKSGRVIDYARGDSLVRHV